MTTSWDEVLGFAKELLGLKTSKKTAIISMMHQYKIKVRTARNLYRDAQNAMDHHKIRHGGRHVN
jgi:hypothetical protein